MDEEEYIVSTKKVSKSGNGFVIRISRDIVNLLEIDENTYLEFKIRKVSSAEKEE